MSDPVCCTVGYEGRSLDELVACLAQEGVERVVDVRLRASSRRPGFAKTALSAALAAGGVGYLHLPLLGNPAENRAGFRSADPSGARAVMRRRLATEGREAMAALIRLAGAERLCLLCFEREESSCHRQVIAEALAEELPGLVRRAL